MFSAAVADACLTQVVLILSGRLSEQLKEFPTNAQKDLSRWSPRILSAYFPAFCLPFRAEQSLLLVHSYWRHFTMYYSETNHFSLCLFYKTFLFEVPGQSQVLFSNLISHYPSFLCAVTFHSISRYFMTINFMDHYPRTDTSSYFTTRKLRVQVSNSTSQSWTESRFSLIWLPVVCSDNLHVCIYEYAWIYMDLYYMYFTFPCVHV